jgi:ribosome biogenesis GTPase / thiamine phosphate phosphatase
VIAPVPQPDFALCDRYLAAAEWAGIEAAVVLNKSDLPGASAAAITRELAVYRASATPWSRPASAPPMAQRAGDGILRQGTSVLVGQSGVGKSSLTNRLVPGVEAAVQEVSRATEEGRHTTTASTLYRAAAGR